MAVDAASDVVTPQTIMDARFNRSVYRSLTPPPLFFVCVCLSHVSTSIPTFVDRGRRVRHHARLCVSRHAICTGVCRTAAERAHLGWIGWW